VSRLPARGRAGRLARVDPDQLALTSAGSLPPDPAEGADFNHLYGVYCAAAQPGGAKLERPDGRAICGATVGALGNYPGKPRCPACREISDAFIAQWRSEAAP
jgi:hypothetical protein